MERCVLTLCYSLIILKILQGRAGHYGAYNCDLPITTLDLLADTLQSLDPQPDFIVYTG